MIARVLFFLGIAGVFGVSLFCRQDLPAQVPQPPPAADALPPVPQGVEVMARGPVHEAFATPTAEAVPTTTIPKQPPPPLEEMPPEEKPEGKVVWISGYWHYDEDRTDYLWVSGCWRAKPPGKEWVPGYWREQGAQWQWVPGFWTDAALVTAGHEEKGKDITYYPVPPAPPQVAPPGERPNPDSFWVPGHWVWNGDRYAWQPGYWARVQPGYVWVAAHYRWTPYGYVHINGYWDLAVAQRGIIYAPVVVDPVVVGPRFVYVPAYAVSHTIVLDTLFVRPGCCHYYFGDYYGPRYRERGFESCVVYSRTHYDSIVVYRTWEHRDEPRWAEVQITLYNDRYHGRAPVPPRTLAQQRTVVNVTNVTNVNNTTVVNKTVNNTTINNVNNTTNNMQVLAPTSKVAAAQGIKTAPVDPSARQAAAVQARTAQQAAVAQRRQAETPTAGGAPTAPRTASLRVPSSPAATAARPAPGGAAQPAQVPRPGGSAVPGKALSRPPQAGPGAPGAQRPPTQANRPGPTVTPRPQPPRPAPPAKRPPDDDKKKSNN